MDFKTIPLLDNYETTLAQEWDGQVGKIKVDDLPSVSVNSEGKFEGGFTTYIIVNPDKANFQLAEIDGYDAINKTLNVINVNLLKGLGVNYNLSHHNQKSIVRISNNFAFWKKLSDVLNSKQDYGNGTISGDYFLNIENGNLKFKDKDNIEISLTDIAGKIGQDKKVSITGEDEASFLQNKLGKGLKVVGNTGNKKVDVDYGAIDLSQVQEETLSENTFVLNENKRKVKIFKKENIDLLNEKIGNIEIVAGENLQKGDVGYIFPDKDIKIFEKTKQFYRTGNYNYENLIKKTQRITLTNQNFKISKIGFYTSSGLTFKIFRNYDFLNMVGTDKIFEKNIYSRDNSMVWTDVSLLPGEYFFEISGGHDGSDVNYGYSKPNLGFLQFGEYKGKKINDNLVNINSESICFGGLFLKSIYPGKVFKNIDESVFYESTRGEINKGDICYDGVVMSSGVKGQNISLKISGVLHKNKINLENKKIGKFFGDYVKIGDFSGKEKLFEDFIG